MSEPPTPTDLPPIDPPNQEAPPPPPPPPAQPPPSPGGVSQNRGIMIALSYLWLLALIPLLTEKDDAEVQWHAKHGIVLMIAGFALMLVLSFLTAIPGLGCIAAILMPLAFLGVGIVHVIAIVKGINGDRFLIPGLSQYADKF